jgi:hypothetical protein
MLAHTHAMNQTRSHLTSDYSDRLLGAAGVIVAPTLAHAAAAAGISIVFLVAAPPATSVPHNLAHLDDSGKPDEGRAASSPVLEARKPRSAATHSRSLSQRPKIV